MSGRRSSYGPSARAGSGVCAGHYRVRDGCTHGLRSLRFRVSCASTRLRLHRTRAVGIVLLILAAFPVGPSVLLGWGIWAFVLGFGVAALMVHSSKVGKLRVWDRLFDQLALLAVGPAHTASSA